uniref:RING-type E3 ubiquitin transferase n=1 Tax=Araucaria cunninghamii TaxID=56994 RepID=A0A0D6R4B5_ARACU
MSGSMSAGQISVVVGVAREIATGSNGIAGESARRFGAYVSRMEQVLKQLDKVLPQPPPPVQTALRGIAADLCKVESTIDAYKNKSKIYILIHCRSLSKTFQEITRSIGNWLALLDLGFQNSNDKNNNDLQKKSDQLSREMQQAQFLVTENEERVCCTLEKEAQGRQTAKAVQNAIIMDIARALGMDPERNRTELSQQVQLLKNDLRDSTEANDVHILDSLERIFDNWAIEPEVVSKPMDSDAEEDAPIPPFKTFLCPLTKEVMKDPVVLESSQTYERSAIQHWFAHCREQGRNATCPVTGQVLKSMELRPNIGLSGTIQEWVERNVDVRIKTAIQHLENSDSLEDNERALDDIYKISEEYPLSRYKLRISGLIPLIVGTIQRPSKGVGSQLRSKVLMTLLSMAGDDESKRIMIEAGVSKLAIKSLTGSFEKEKEYAVKLLLEFSQEREFCLRIASEKGSVLLLSGMAGNAENPTLSNLAEETLRKMEEMEENVQHLASAGRFQPFLTRLCEGSEDIQIKMADCLARMTLSNNGKELIARKGAKVLVNMLSSTLEAKTLSLKALFNLSTLDDNSAVLVDAGILPPLMNVLFKVHSVHNPAPTNLKELGAATLANIVSRAGHWEFAAADSEGNSLQSEVIIHNLLGLLTHVGPNWKVKLLQILYGIASSPQAAESAAVHIKNGNGIVTLIAFLEDTELDHRIHAFKLISVLSERLGEQFADALRNSRQLILLKEKLSTPKEGSAAACILANLPLSDDEVKNVLGTDLIGWIVNALADRRGSRAGRNAWTETTMVEGLLGILLHFVHCSDKSILDCVQHNQLMLVFKEHLLHHRQPKAKQRSAKGLKYLSEIARIVAKESEPQPPNGWCASLMLMCMSSPPSPILCPVHGVPCDQDSSFCLLKANAISPLVELLEDSNIDVQIAVVEALSTLLSDSNNLRRCVEELDKVEAVQGVIDLFFVARPGQLQEKTVWMIERILRVEDQAQKYSIDQSLVKALVEAFKHGNPNTKDLAQSALTNLKQLSGVSGGVISRSRPQRVGNHG